MYEGKHKMGATRRHAGVDVARSNPFGAMLQQHSIHCTPNPGYTDTVLPNGAGARCSIWIIGPPKLCTAHVGLQQNDGDQEGH